MLYKVEQTTDQRNRKLLSDFQPRLLEKNRAMKTFQTYRYSNVNLRKRNRISPWYTTDDPSLPINSCQNTQMNKFLWEIIPTYQTGSTIAFGLEKLMTKYQ